MNIDAIQHRIEPGTSFRHALRVLCVLCLLWSQGTPAFGAREFDGVDDELKKTSASAALTPSNNFSICIRVIPGTATDAHADIMAHGSNYVLRWVPSTSRIQLFKHVSGNWVAAEWVYSAGQFQAGVQYSLCGVYRSTGTGVELYVNGESRATAASTANFVYDQGSNFVIGKHGEGSSTFDYAGRAQDAVVYAGVLSVTAIESYHAGAYPPSLGVVAGYWPLFGTSNPEPDWSGNGNHLTVSGAVRGDHLPRSGTPGVRMSSNRLPASMLHHPNN
ncbi:MAG: LamG-like jellyroll fold domain-containing protein [Candidatus Korobacteraceae bacterium]